MKQYTIGRKVVGTLRPDRVYVTHRTARHYFVKYKGFGISFNILHDLMKLGCHTIILIYENTKKEQTVFMTTPEMFMEHGIIWQDNMDFQRILPLEHWRKG